MDEKIEYIFPIYDAHGKLLGYMPKEVVNSYGIGKDETKVDTLRQSKGGEG